MGLVQKDWNHSLVAKEGSQSPGIASSSRVRGSGGISMEVASCSGWDDVGDDGGEGAWAELFSRWLCCRRWSRWFCDLAVASSLGQAHGDTVWPSFGLSRGGWRLAFGSSIRVIGTLPTYSGGHREQVRGRIRKEGGRTGDLGVIRTLTWWLRKVSWDSRGIV